MKNYCCCLWGCEFCVYRSQIVDFRCCNVFLILLDKKTNKEGYVTLKRATDVSRMVYPSFQQG